MDDTPESLKKLGNECILNNKPIEAMVHYTKAIKMDPKNHYLYSNRSLAFLKMDDYYHAREDALSVIRLQPQWPKGYYRKAEAEFKAQHYDQAVLSYKAGLLHDQSDQKLLEGYSASARELRLLTNRERRQPWYGLSVGAVIGLLIVLLDSLVTEKSVIKHLVLQIGLIAAFAAIGAAVALMMRYFQRAQRQGLLDEPVDLLKEMDSGSSEQPAATHTDTHAGRRRKSGGKARLRTQKT